MHHDQQRGETYSAIGEPLGWEPPASEVGPVTGSLGVAGENQATPGHGYRQDSPSEIIALLHQAQAGDTDAFAGIYRSQVDRVTRYVATRMRHHDRDAVPDIVQEAFCEAFANLGAAHHDVTGWLLAQAAKACIRYRWSNRRYVRAAFQEQERLATNQQPPAEVPIGIGRLALVQALSRLNPAERQAVQLRFLEGLPRQERAKELDRSLDSLKTLESRALKNLRLNFIQAEVPAHDE